MNFLQKIYKKSKEQKGFTLVEMIVVLVIIAILAAITIPALLKYIDKAREKQVVINARTAYLAAETAMSEAYAENKGITSPLTFKNTDANVTSPANDQEKVQKNASELTGITKGYTCKVTFDANKKITEISYAEDGGKTATMKVTSGSSWEIK